MSEKKQVLTISRSAAGLMYLGVLLNRMWYKPVLVKTVDEALDHVRTSLFAAIVLDGDLSSEERESAVGTLKTEPAIRNLPLIVLLADDSPSVSESLISQGCSAVLSKPLDISFFYGIMGRLSGQQRQAHRIPVKMRVEIEEAVPEKELTSINISEGGLYLRTHMPLPERTLLHLKFLLPRDTEEIAVVGEVVRVVPLGSDFETEPGMGLRFVGLPEKALERIRNFVQWETAGDIVWESSI